MKRIYLKAAIIHEFLKGNDSLETMIFCNNDKIKFVTDVWKFTKNIKKNSPNWYLSEIISK